MSGSARACGFGAVALASALVAMGCDSSGTSVVGTAGQGGSPTGEGGTSINVGGMGAGGSGGNGLGGNGICSTEMTGVLRDFSMQHPDFEHVVSLDYGIVEYLLGSDGKPVYAHGPQGTVTTTGPDNFNQWYRDVPDVNERIEFTIYLTDDGGVYSYDNAAFFPIDDQGWGNQGYPHNYHFTFELRTQFLYETGNVFSFTGDDDLFVFINGRLVIDLGGVHPPLDGEVDLDEKASELGIVPGEIYPLDFFFAERHFAESNFHISTNIAFVNCDPPPPE